MRDVGPSLAHLSSVMKPSLLLISAPSPGPGASVGAVCSLPVLLSLSATIAVGILNPCRVLVVVYSVPVDLPGVTMLHILSGSSNPLPRSSSNRPSTKTWIWGAGAAGCVRSKKCTPRMTDARKRVVSKKNVAISQGMQLYFRCGERRGGKCGV